MKLEEITILAEGRKLKRKKDMAAPAPGPGTTTGDIAPFQHRLFGKPLRREQPKPVGSGKRTTQEINAGHYVGGWTTRKPTPYDHPMNQGLPNTQLSDEDAPQLASEEFQTANLDYMWYKLGDHGESLPSELAEDNPDDDESASWKSPDKHLNRSGKFTHQNTAKGKGKKTDKRKNESTTTIGVANTDTRMGGANWEPVYFDDTPHPNALDNETEFERSEPVTAHDYKFIQDDKFASQTKASKRQNKIMEPKNYEIDFDLEKPKDSYRDLLKRLGKAHNI